MSMNEHRLSPLNTQTDINCLILFKENSTKCLSVSEFKHLSSSENQTHTHELRRSRGGGGGGALLLINHVSNYNLSVGECVAVAS